MIYKGWQRKDQGCIEKKINAPLGAIEAEAMAFKASLIFSKDMGIQDFIIKGDSLIIHRALCEASTPPSSMAAVVQGMQEPCRKFHRVEFSHVKRQGNRQARLVTKHTSGNVDYTA